MSVNIITKEDLEIFKQQLLSEIKTMLECSPSTQQNKWLASCKVKKIIGASDSRLRRMRIKREIEFKQIGGRYYYRLPF